MPGLLDRLRLQGEVLDLSGRAPGAREQEGCSQDLSGGAPEGDATKGLDPLEAVQLIRQRLLNDQPSLLEQSPAGGAQRARLKQAVDEIICRENVVVKGLTREALTDVVVCEMSGLGPLEPLLRDPLVTDVMVNGPDDVWIERDGRLQQADVRFRDETHLRDTVARLLAPLGRRLDTLAPYVDARLQDGSRLNVVIPPITRHGFVATIRRFRQRPLSLDDLVGLGFLPATAGALLEAAVRGRLNILVSGGAGSGKTTLLNAMCLAVSGHERVVTIEDAAELRLRGIHAVGLEARPPNVEGRGQVTIRQLLTNALRMRPDRLVIGEIRDVAAFEFLQAINTGHAGSMATVHANTAGDALYRLENLALMAAGNVVLAAIRSQISSALDLVLHLARAEDGTRRLAEVGVVGSPGEGGAIGLLPLAQASGAGGETSLALLMQRSLRRGSQERAVDVVGAAKAFVGEGRR